MTGKALFISRTIAIFSWLKRYFDEAGFWNIDLYQFGSDALASKLDELKPQNVFMDSEFYTGVTPYMIGELLRKFPKMKIHVVNFGNFPDSLAVRFIFHGARSFIDFRDGTDEFRKALRAICSCGEYYSPGIKSSMDNLDEKQNLKGQVTDRQWQVLFLICNGFSENQIAAALEVSRGTVDKHIENLYKIFDTENRIEVLKKAINLGWVRREELRSNRIDIAIPHHPSRKRSNQKNEVKKRYALLGKNPRRKAGEKF